MASFARAAPARRPPLLPVLAAALLLAVSSTGPSGVQAGDPTEDRGDKLASAPNEALPILGAVREPNAGGDATLDIVPEYLSLAGAFSNDSLMATMTLLTSYPTRYTSNANYAAAAARMRDCFTALGLDQVYLHNFTCCGGTRQNVVAIKLGTVTPNEIVIVGAHLDCTSQSPNTNAPGAEDNASGSAAVYELARLLANVPTQRTIHFVLFGGEEQGLYGSEAYAAKADLENWNVTGVITMDMVGYYGAGGADLWLEGFTTGVNSMWLVNLVSQHAQTYSDLSVYIYPGNGWGSDHESFHDHGFPAMLSIENEWDSYPCYHRSCDTIANITPSFLRQIAAANGTAALELAVPAFTPAAVGGRVDLAGVADDSGATVTILGTSYAPAVSSTDGSYSLPNVLPGTYTLRAAKQGYLPVTMTGVVLSSGESAAIDFLLLPEQNGIPEETVPVAPSALVALGPATPSPFAAATDIAYTLRAAGRVWLRLFDAQGRVVRELVPGEERAQGRHRARWDGRDAEGRAAPSGVYWAEIRAEAGGASVLAGNGGRSGDASAFAARGTARLPIVRLR